MSQEVGIEIKCKVATPTVPLGTSLVTTCTLPGIKAGLPVQMQLNQDGKWHTVLVSSAGGANRTFSVAFGIPGKYVVRVLLPKSKFFKESASKPLTFTVQ